MVVPKAWLRLNPLGKLRSRCPKPPAAWKNARNEEEKGKWMKREGQKGAERV